MASFVSSVMVLGLNGRRHSQKVTPNTSILQVLEEACKKHGVNPDDYDLKHGNRTLDLSSTVRFANIPNNALLELQPTNKIRKEGNVTVGIQLESGERLMGDFSPSSSIWDVVCHCLSQRNESPNHGGDDGSSVPTCVYMRQMISGEELKGRTLRSLGLTDGNAMFRLIYRQPDQLQKQAHVSAPLKKNTRESVSELIEGTESDELDVSAISRKPGLDKQEEEAGNSIREHSQWLPSSAPYRDNTSSSGKSQTDGMEPQKPFSVEPSLETSSDLKVPGNIYLSELVSVPSTQANELLSENLNLTENSNLENPMDIDSISEDNEGTEMEETGTVTIIGERNAVLFNLDDVSSMPKIDLPDDFYDITVDDVRYLLQEYKHVRSEMENKPLELQSQKQTEIFQHFAQYTQTVIRVQFPDRLVLQGVFSVDETVKSVMEFVQGFLENKELNFYLYTSPPKANLLPEKTLLESRLLPAALIYFGCGKYLRSYLKPCYRSQLSDPGAVSKAASAFRIKSVSSIPSDLRNIHIDENVNVEVNLQQNLDVPSTSNSCSLRRTDHSGSKTPKWLKLSKK